MAKQKDSSTLTVEDGSILALDVGDVRIGLAVSESRTIAATLPSIERNGRRATLDALERVIGQHEVRAVILGLPLLENGNEGDQAEKTRAFARSLQRRLPQLNIDFWDERYTSAEAKEILGGESETAGRVDSVAAAVILQEFLDHDRNGNGSGEKNGNGEH